MASRRLTVRERAALEERERIVDELLRLTGGLRPTVAYHYYYAAWIAAGCPREWPTPTEWQDWLSEASARVGGPS